MKTRIGLMIFVLAGIAHAGGEPGSMHDNYDQLLQRFVKGKRVDYAAWHSDKQALQALDDYLQAMQQAKPSKMDRKQALAYWINLYNAVTLKLILDNYPLESIKDLGGLFSSPWEKKLVTVESKKLTLNAIENEIIRPQFNEPRIHFAVNCASLSCPPLHNRAFVADKLDQQLELVTKQVLTDENYVRIGKDKIHVTKIFDWYGDDFKQGKSTIRSFIAHYRPQDKAAILDENRKLEFMDYSWKLNSVKGR